MPPVVATVGRTSHLDLAGVTRGLLPLLLLPAALLCPFPAAAAESSDAPSPPAAGKSPGWSMFRGVLVGEVLGDFTDPEAQEGTSGNLPPPCWTDGPHPDPDLSDPEKRKQIFLRDHPELRQTLAKLKKQAAAFQKEREEHRRAVQEKFRELGEAAQLFRAADIQTRAMALAMLTNPGRGQVKGKIYDARTGHPLAARVRLTSAAEAIAGEKLPGVGFWCHGSFTVRCFSGPATLEVSAGRFAPTFRTVVQVPAGGTIRVDIPLSRPLSLEHRRRGYVLAELRHRLCSMAGRVEWLGEGRRPGPSVMEVAVASRAEGSDVLGLCAPWCPPERMRRATRADELRQLRREMVLASRQTGLKIALAAESPRSPLWGRVFSFGLQNPWWVWAKDYDLEAPNALGLEEVRAQGGATFYAGLWGASAAPLEGLLETLAPAFAARLRQWRIGRHNPYAAAELPLDTVAGPLYHGLDFDGSPAVEAVWFALLNLGYQVPVVAAGEGCLQEGKLPFGGTFVRVGEEFTWECFMRALRAGRSTVSFGPAVFCRLEERGLEPGDVALADGRLQTLVVDGYASLTPLRTLAKLEVIRNGQVAVSVAVPGGISELRVARWRFAESQTAWYVVKLTDEQGDTAYSNPFYFAPGGVWRSPRPLQTIVEGKLTDEQGHPLCGRIVAARGGGEGKIELDGPAVEVTPGQGGRFRLVVSPTARLFAFADGYRPEAALALSGSEILEQLAALGSLSKSELVRELSRPAQYQLARFLAGRSRIHFRLTPQGAAANAHASP